MRILYLVQTFATVDDPSGIRHFAHAKALAEQGHDVTVVTADRLQKGGEQISRRTQNDEQIGGFRVLRTKVALMRPGFRGRLAAYLSFMFRSIGRGIRTPGKFDVVFATSPPLFVGLSGVLLARMKRARFVLEVRDLWPQSAIVLGFIRNPLLIHLTQHLEKWLYRRAAIIVCVTEGIANEIRRYERVRDKVHVVRNGVDKELFDRASFLPCGDLRGPNSEKFIAVYAGVHGVNNALDVLIDAARELKDDSIHFVLIGVGSETELLKQQCKRLGLSNVTFIGSMPRKDVPKWLLCADALLWPVYLKSQNPELVQLKRGAVPNKLYDYLAAGKPVITSVPADGEGAELLRQFGDPHFVGPNGSDFAQCLRELKNRVADQPADRVEAFRKAYSRDVQAAILMEILGNLIER